MHSYLHIYTWYCSTMRIGLKYSWNGDTRSNCWNIWNNHIDEQMRFVIRSISQLSLFRSIKINPDYLLGFFLHVIFIQSLGTRHAERAKSSNVLKHEIWQSWTYKQWTWMLMGERSRKFKGFVERDKIRWPAHLGGGQRRRRHRARPTERRGGKGREERMGKKTRYVPRRESWWHKRWYRPASPRASACTRAITLRRPLASIVGDLTTVSDRKSVV